MRGPHEVVDGGAEYYLPLPEEGASGGHGLMKSPGEVLGDDGLPGPCQALRPGPKADGPGYPGFHGLDS